MILEVQTRESGAVQRTLPFKGPVSLRILLPRGYILLDEAGDEGSAGRRQAKAAGREEVDTGTASVTES